MSNLLPSALILGIEHFAAKKLAEELVNKDIRVVGVGEYVLGLNEIKNFEWANDVGEVEGNFNYVFDFKEDKNTWEKIDGEKFILISVNDKERANFLKKETEEWEMNWRIIESYETYGVGMSDESFLAKVMREAVQNKNLELPDISKKFKVLSVVDLTEAVLRASFLSGTEKDVFLILGKETNSEEVAKILIDEAKMTRFKIMQKEIVFDQGDETLALESNKKLRWEAKITLSKGIKETLQYFFSKLDEENRQKKKNKNLITKVEIGNKQKEERGHGRNFEVIVEEKEPVLPIQEEPKLIDYSIKKSNYEAPVLQDEIEEVVGEDYIEEESEEFLEIPKIKFNNSIEDQDKSKTAFAGSYGESKKKWGWLGLVVAIIILLILPVSWIVETAGAVNNVKKGWELIKNKKYVQAGVIFKKSVENVDKIDNEISDWNLNKWKTMRNYQTGLRILSDLLTMENKSITLIKSMDLLNEAIFRGKEIDWPAELAKTSDGLAEMKNKMGVLQARLNGDYSWLPARWKMSVQKQANLMEEIKGQLEMGMELSKILPDFLGVGDTKREYLVLFQNESELRSTGGFIGSYGLLSFEKGTLKNFEIKDVYEADGQLKGHVEPPWEIKTYLNEANWYMRDANWNADFTKTADDIQWFLDKETGKKVDGVIGIDLAVAKSMLEATGEIYIPDFKEKINKDNLYEQAEFYAETKFFPGSVQKASFLGAVGKQLFEEIKNLKTDKRALLLQSMVDLLKKNEIQIALNNKETAKILDDLGVSGKIYNGKCGVDNCVSDYLYLVESNFGVNKANYFLYRNVEQMVEITANSIGRIIKINYENTAKNSNWPGGDYKNYLRAYVPAEVNISQVSVADGDNPSNKKIYNSDELKIREINGKKEIGFLVTVPVLKKRVVEIRYSSSINIDSTKNFSYLNYIQRQPGSGETGLVNLISFPDKWQPIQVQPAANLVGGKLLFNQKLDRDIKMGVELGI
ncbi:MAG: DUF4012 domain-containing protein [Candidatus Shapirobacteria bacterium]|jgi:hypothetical protein